MEVTPLHPMDALAQPQALSAFMYRNSTANNNYNGKCELQHTQ